MMMWILAVVLLAGVGYAGFKQGAIRAASSFVGLLLAAILCFPLGKLFNLLLPLTGLKHPVLLAFLGPAVAYILILVISKVVGHTVHKKVEAHYKYDLPDTYWTLWERFNQRLGLCVGLGNATIYTFLIGMVSYLIGYGTVQFSTPGEDSFSLKIANGLARSVQSSGFVRALAPFIPTGEQYFDAADILGDIYHTPLLQSRLLRYPALVPMVDRPEVRALADDVAFQEMWLRQPRPSLSDFMKNQKFKELVQSREVFENGWPVVKSDLKDLRQYLVTAKSEKYGDERILGLWDFNMQASLLQARKNKPNLGSVELRTLRRLYATMLKASFAAMPDNKAILKIPTTNTVQVSTGTWRSAGGSSYKVSLTEGSKNLEVEATVDGDRLVVSKDGSVLVFEK